MYVHVPWAWADCKNCLTPCGTRSPDITLPFPLTYLSSLTQAPWWSPSGVPISFKGLITSQFFFSWKFMFRRTSSHWDTELGVKRIRCPPLSVTWTYWSEIFYFYPVLTGGERSRVILLHTRKGARNDRVLISILDFLLGVDLQQYSDCTDGGYETSGLSFENNYQFSIICPLLLLCSKIHFIFKMKYFN